jgi:signal transduction histidine kinase
MDGTGRHADPRGAGSQGWDLLASPVSAALPDGGLPRLCRALAGAPGAARAALVSRLAPEGARVLAHSWDGDPPPHLDALAPAAVAAAHGEDGAEVPPGAVGVPVPGSLRGAALLVLGAQEPPEGSPGAALLANSAERAGAVVEVWRLRGDLDRAMAQILETDERMLGRIGLDIHDGPTQHLSVALLEIQLLEADLADAAAAGAELPEPLLPALERVYETLGGALTEMRELIGHLRPAQFEDRRLSDILREVVTAFEARSGTEVDVEMRGEFPVNGVSVTQRITFYRILQEALNNAHRHGHARAVAVLLAEEDGGTLLEVRDDGRGFDAAAAMRPALGAPIARFGLHGMRDRTSLLGGTFSVASAPGEGCTLRVHLPDWRPPEDAAPDGR